MTTEKLKVYTASSWRNPVYPEVVRSIKEAGFSVYDFQNPWDKGAAFNWNQVDASWTGGSDMAVSADSFVAGIQHPIAKRGFSSDLSGMKWANVGVLILPCGKSAHMEGGWFVGAGKPLHILLEDPLRPELTYSLAMNHKTIDDLIIHLRLDALDLVA